MVKMIRTVAFFAIFLFIGCVKPTIYTKPEFSDITKSHKKVAVLPFVVTIDSKNQSKEFTIDVARKAERDEAYMFQQQIYSQFLKQQSKGMYTVEFQDTDHSNTLLSKSGITYENLSNYTKSDIARYLGVDAVISGTIRRSKPMSSAGAIVLGLLGGFWGSTNRVDVTINLHDGSNGDLLWKYDHEASGSIGSSSEGLAKSLMKGISKDFPYKKQKK
jgi:TolB-like protein